MPENSLKMEPRCKVPSKSLYCYVFLTIAQAPSCKTTAYRLSETYSTCSQHLAYLEAFSTICILGTRVSRNVAVRDKHDLWQRKLCVCKSVYRFMAVGEERLEFGVGGKQLNITVLRGPSKTFDIRTAFKVHSPLTIGLYISFYTCICVCEVKNRTQLNFRYWLY